MKLSWFIANRVGKTGKLSLWGDVIAKVSVAISIAVIILAIAIATGFRREIKNSAVGFCGDATLSPAGFSAGGDADLSIVALTPLRFIDKIKNLPYVASIQEVSYRPGLIKAKDQIQGIILKGAGPSYNWSFFKNSLLCGRLPLKDSVNEVLLSQRIADMLSLGLNDKATFYFVGENIKMRRFKIVGIYSARLEEYDKLYVITSKAVVDKLNGWVSGQMSNYEILFKDHNENKMEHRRKRIQEIIFDNTKDGEQLLVASSLKESFYRLFDWLKLLDINVLVILSLMIAVAGFNMVSAILIILFENISKIGVFKTLGMNNTEIKKIFLAKSCKTIFYGLLEGNIFALGLCALQSRYHFLTLNPDNYFLSYVPCHLVWFDVILIDILCFTIIMAIVLLPLHFINKLDPSLSVKIE